MKTSARAALLSLALFGAGSVFSQTTATTDPVGFVSVSVLANSDATLAVPLNRTAAFKGVIQSISGNTITVAGTSPAWQTSPMIFVQSLPSQTNTYAVQFATGAKEGMTASITANGANTVTIQLASGDNLTGVKTEAVDGTGNGDHIDIMPYWTPSTLFSTTPPAGTELIGFANPDNGVNVGASEVYDRTGASAWEDGINGGDASHFPLPFGSSFIFRNNTASALSLSLVGSVPMTKNRVRISTQANNTDQDVAIGYLSPIPERLSTIGLPPYNPADPTNPNNLKQGEVASANALGFPVANGDTIIGFDNNELGINKGAAEVYQWTGSSFEDGINGGTISNTVTLKPGFGYIFRKAATPTPTSVVWSHLPGYLQ